MKKEELLKRAEEKVKHGEEFLKITPNVREWKKELEFDKQIVALIKKEVTEEWIEEKATELDHLIADGHLNYHHQCKDFICLIVEEIHGRK